MTMWTLLTDRQKVVASAAGALAALVLGVGSYGVLAPATTEPPTAAAPPPSVPAEPVPPSVGEGGGAATAPERRPAGRDNDSRTGGLLGGSSAGAGQDRGAETSRPGGSGGRGPASGDGGRAGNGAGTGGSDPQPGPDPQPDPEPPPVGGGPDPSDPGDGGDAERPALAVDTCPLGLACVDLELDTPSSLILP